MERAGCGEVVEVVQQPIGPALVIGPDPDDRETEPPGLDRDPFRLIDEDIDAEGGRVFRTDLVRPAASGDDPLMLHLRDDASEANPVGQEQETDGDRTPE